MNRRAGVMVAIVILAMLPGFARPASSARGESTGGGASGGTGKAPTTAPATQPAMSVMDADGQIRHPLEVPADQRAAVLLFIATDCPIANSYAQEFGRLVRDYQSKGFAIYFVYSSSQITAAAAKAHAHQFALDSTLLLDTDGALAARVEARVTPEAVVIGSSDQILYRGRIDDLYYALGKRRFDATHHDLRDALDAIAAGKPVPNPRMPTIGCAIGN